MHGNAAMLGRKCHLEREGVPCVGRMASCYSVLHATPSAIVLPGARVCCPSYKHIWSIVDVPLESD